MFFFVGVWELTVLPSVGLMCDGTGWGVRRDGVGGKWELSRKGMGRCIYIC